MMKRDRFFYFWILLLLVGVICTGVLFGGRVRAESRDDRVASAVYFDDVIRLAELSGQTADEWLALFSGSGVRYVIFEARPDEAVQELLSGFDLSPAGYVGEESAFGLPEYGWSADTDLPLALVENVSRTSVHYPENFDLDSYDGPLVKAFYLYDGHVATCPIGDSSLEAENMLLRAVIDRGMRLILLRPFVDLEGAVVANSAVYADILSGLGEQLEKRGLEYGESFSCMETMALRPMLLLGSGCLTAALWIFLVTRLKVLRRWEFVLCLLALAGMALGVLFLPGLMQKVLVLLCAMVFPCVAVYGLWRWRKCRCGQRLSDWLAYLLTLCAVLVWSVLGGFAVGALMGSRRYLMGDLIFSGVKVAQAVPLLFCLVLFVIPVVKEFFDGPVTKKKVLPLLGVTGLLIAAGAVLILRSGDVSWVSALEGFFRDFLEHTLYTRPRTKELLVAVPFMMVGFTPVGRRNSLIALLASLCFCLESVSVINTFCHAVAPLHVSLIRSALGAGMGGVLGLVLIVLCRISFRFTVKSAGNQLLDQ